MTTLLYFCARALVALLQALPLHWVARLGRWGGTVAYQLDARHRRVAVENLTRAFGGELTQDRIRLLAKENFARLGEGFACAVRTAAMSGDEVRKVLEVTGVGKIARPDGPARSCVMAIGHFGNFELYARANLFVPGFQMATTYRALRQPAYNRLLQDLRSRSGCLYFERRLEGNALKDAMNRQRLMIGFLVDQHAGDRGLRQPFLGHDCSTTPAPAIFALRYGCPLLTAICYRIAPARWRIEVGDEIPTHADGKPRTVEEITRDINAAFEVAVRRDPANWFWVHRRWKPGKSRPRAAEEPAVDSAGPQPPPNPTIGSPADGKG